MQHVLYYYMGTYVHMRTCEFRLRITLILMIVLARIFYSKFEYTKHLSSLYCNIIIMSDTNTNKNIHSSSTARVTICIRNGNITIWAMSYFTHLHRVDCFVIGNALLPSTIWSPMQHQHHQNNDRMQCIVCVRVCNKRDSTATVSASAT